MVGSRPVFHAHGATTEKALSPILRFVRGTTKSPLTDARSEDHAGMLATGIGP